MDENTLQKAFESLGDAFGDAVRALAKETGKIVDDGVQCMKCYKFLNCWACEKWLRCDEKKEKAERVQCFKCDGIGCSKTRRK